MLINSRRFLPADWAQARRSASQWYCRYSPVLPRLMCAVGPGGRAPGALWVAARSCNGQRPFTAKPCLVTVAVAGTGLPELFGLSRGFEDDCSTPPGRVKAILKCVRATAELIHYCDFLGLLLDFAVTG